MLLADDVVLNPAEAPMVPARVEKSLSEMGLSVRSFDPGENVSGDNGSSEKTRTLSMTLMVDADADVDLPAAAYELQQVVGRMQEEPESWIKRVPKVGGTFAGPVMYRIRRAPGADEPRVSLSNFGGWQVGQNPEVTLTLVGDIVAYATEETEGESHSTSTARHLLYTEDGAKGSARGLRRIRVANNNSSGDLRGLIFASEARDYSPDPTAELFYEAKSLTPLGIAEITEGSGVKELLEAKLTSGWAAILGTKIVGKGHMTHRGGRRPWLRVYDPGSTVNNVELRLWWRALGSSRWEEGNPIAPVYVVQNWCLIDLRSVLPQVASTGEERWEGKLMARALSGTGTIRVRDFYPLPTEQYAVLREIGEAPIDGEPTAYPGSAEDATGVGSVAWSEPAKAAGSNFEDAAVASNASTTEEKTTHYLKLTNFGFAIPAAATIRGIELKFARFAEHLVKDSNVRVVKGGSVKTASEHSAGADWRTISPETVTFGGVGDLWGNTWTPADINTSGFGVALSATLGKATLGTVNAKAIAAEIVVSYTETSNENRVCFATRCIDLGSNGCFRQAATEDAWGRVNPNGALPFAPPAGLEGRQQRTILIPSQGDLTERADVGTNKLGAVEFERPGYDVAREAG